MNSFPCTHLGIFVFTNITIIIRAKFTPGGGTPQWIDPTGVHPYYQM